MSPSATAAPIHKISIPRVVHEIPSPLRLVKRHGAALSRAFLNEVLLESQRLKEGSKTADVLLALLVHVALIGGPVVAGLYFTDTINLKQFATTFLVAPPPPPPPPPAAAAGVIKSQTSKRVFIREGKLLAPTYIPKQVAQLKEAPIEADAFGGVLGGVPGGVPGGQLGGVIGGVIGGVLNTAAKPVAPPAEKSGAPIRVGGRVRPPKVIMQVRPQYPTLARQTRVQGDVKIDAILDEQGNVIEMRIVSGHPLLWQPALDALSKWKYEPTYLNDRPIAVQLVVTITFQLSQ
jgi:periplasmic protein TonB